MASKNDITGDLIKSKPGSNKYRDNWDRIFGKPKPQQSEKDRNELARQNKLG